MKEEQYKAKFGAVKSIDIKSASLYTTKRKANWTIKTPTERKVEAKVWAWNNEY